MAKVKTISLLFLCITVFVSVCFAQEEQSYSFLYRNPLSQSEYREGSILGKLDGMQLGIKYKK